MQLFYRLCQAIKWFLLKDGAFVISFTSYFLQKFYTCELNLKKTVKMYNKVEYLKIRNMLIQRKYSN